MNIKDYSASKFNDIACKAREANALLAIKEFPELFEAIENTSKKGKFSLLITENYSVFKKVTDDVIEALKFLEFDVFDRREWPNQNDKELKKFIEISWSNKKQSRG